MAWYILLWEFQGFGVVALTLVARLFAVSFLRKNYGCFFLAHPYFAGGQVEDVHGGFGQDRTERPPLQSGDRRGSLLLAGKKGSTSHVLYFQPGALLHDVTGRQLFTQCPQLPVEIWNAPCVPSVL